MLGHIILTLARFLHNVFESVRSKEVVDLGVELMKLTNDMWCKIAASTTAQVVQRKVRKHKELER